MIFSRGAFWFCFACGLIKALRRIGFCQSYLAYRSAIATWLKLFGICARVTHGVRRIKIAPFGS